MAASIEQLAIDAFATNGMLCARVDALPDAFDELAERLKLGGFATVSYDIAGLAEMIRAGKNGTEVPNPHKPFSPPKPTPPPRPRHDPPKPPPSKPGGR